MKKTEVKLDVMDLPAAKAIPVVPAGFVALDGPQRQALLKVPEDQRAEVNEAMEELWEKRAQVSEDLHHLAPDAERGQALYQRMNQAHDVSVQAAALAAFTSDQEARAQDAVMTHLNDAADEIEHAGRKNAQILTRYQKVLRVVQQRREAIAAGIARAKAQKGDPTKPT
jgi:hypothetical protein